MRQIENRSKSHGLINVQSKEEKNKRKLIENDEALLEGDYYNLKKFKIGFINKENTVEYFIGIDKTNPPVSATNSITTVLTSDSIETEK